MIWKKMLALAAGAVAAAGPAYALDAGAAKALAQKNACMSCHAVDKKLVGPAYKDIAAKYKGMKPEELAASIKKGGAGKWGPVPMPAQAALSDGDAKLLAEWVLAGAPDK
ncbi:c-type cytochrome [Tepidimonas charontis]|uniref:Cytochrome c-551 n=1 Tax=Tepidimonas charontis TaxID=2267262 RepID=A0A554X9S0_9BURK|nr:c-type cytochrome [Tepidimonas charontis]TSE32595.1 Cytochrome c-551 [Tepidimonas charontis]